MKGLWNSESIIHVTLCFIFFFICYFKDVLAAPTTRHLLSRPEQRDALLAFKNEFHIGKPNRYCPNDSHRKMESWGNNSDCCSWKGIKCNAKSGEVVELDLSCSFLHGRFHSNSSLQNLHFLTTLDLSFNDLTGQIPDSIGNHSHLINLILSGNHFSGRIPSSIGNLFHLTFLDLFYNQLSGQIPSSIGNLSQLTGLCLFKNNLVGEIPSFYGNLNQLTSLFVGGNMLSGNFPNVLLNLTFLLELDISNNQFSGALPPNITEFPEVPRTQHEMRLLDISNNKLEGQVPSWLWTLPKLVYVNLSNNTFNGFERSKKKQGLSSVRKPSILYLLGSNNNFTGKIPSFICAMRSLSALDLSSNNFSCSIPHCLGNLKSNLSVLNLRQNNLSGGLPKDIFESLRSLDVSHNQLVGKLPRSLNRFSTLEVLNMESNRINDTFPFWLGSLQKLQVLVLRSNAFHGPIHQASFPRLRIIDISHNHFDGTLSSEYFVKWSAMSSLGTDEDQPSQKYMKDESRCYYNSMVLINKGVDLELVHILQIYTAIDFSRNKFEGEIPNSIGLLKELRVLNLSNNAFTGHMPSSMGNLKALELLDVSQNKLSGEIPQELGNLFKNQHEMTLLDISNNKLKGQVPSWLWTLPKLVYMNLSNNTFNGFERSKKKQGLSSVRKPSMVHLLGSNNNFTGKIPSFICTLRSLSVLDLSRNKFNGSIPHCLGNLNSTLLDLNLRKNNLSGGLPKDIFERLRSLDVGHNQLVGKLPRSLNRFSTLEVLNVESNRINDTFPFWIGSLQKLQVLVLRSNAFHGPIHQASFPQLRIIDISHNHFDGTLPSEYFAKWSAMLSLGKNEVGSDEMYMGDGYYQDSLVLMNKGVEWDLVRILQILTAIDFSGNKFEGEIPNSIGLLKELHVLNLENNAFTGCMPSSIGNLKALESLDVSQNKLSGEIPQGLGELSFLAYMNFSHNKLTGLVPGGTQFRTQACSSFEGNLRLFGPSFDEVCRDIHTLPSHQQYETPESEEEDKEEVISWIAASIGFMPGIVFGLKIGYILLSYKPKWFMNPFGRNNRRRRSTTTH